MNPQHKTKAEEIFREKFIESFGEFQLEQWLEKNDNILNEVIIPSIVQALNQTSAKNAEVGRRNPSLKNVGIASHGITPICQTKEQFEKSNSKIQEGQKLKDGDYFEGGTVEQYEEIFKIEASRRIDISESVRYSINDGFTVYTNYSGYILGWGKHKRKTSYEFPDFKQLCINTFSDGE